MGFFKKGLRELPTSPLEKGRATNPLEFKIKGDFMWIKSLTRETWINMNHITHFHISISLAPNEKGTYDVMAHLDATEMRLDRANYKPIEDQAYVTVYKGTLGKCKRFIWQKRFREWLSKWIGYLVAGGVGAVLTFLFSQLFPK